MPETGSVAVFNARTGRDIMKWGNFNVCRSTMGKEVQLNKNPGSPLLPVKEMVFIRVRANKRQDGWSGK